MLRRGLHINTRGKDSLPSLQRIIGDIAPSLGFNWIILGVTGNFAYQSHPECAEPDSIDATDAHRLAQLARDNGITLVPEYNCLGHQSFQEKAHALLRAHPEYNEAPDMDMHAFTYHNFYSWCPNRHAVYDIVFDLLDELIDAFSTKSIHLGMDEVFVLGECHLCKETPRSQLFAKAVNDLHQHVVEVRGLEMMIWGDRLLQPSTGYNLWERSNNETEDAIHLIPKDIIMCDWHYEIMESNDYPSIRIFQDSGFRVWPAGWNVPDAVSRLIEVARRDDAGKMIGYLATTWIPVDQLAASLAGEPVTSPNKELAGVTESVILSSRLIR